MSGKYFLRHFIDKINKPYVECFSNICKYHFIKHLWEEKAFENMKTHFILNLFIFFYLYKLGFFNWNSFLTTCLVFIPQSNNIVVKPYLSSYRSVMHINSIC